jgi:hypothetical protein
MPGAAEGLLHHHIPPKNFSWTSMHRARMNRFDLFCVRLQAWSSSRPPGEAQRILAHVRSCSRADKLIVAELDPRHQPWSADNGGIGAGVRGTLLFHLAFAHGDSLRRPDRHVQWVKEPNRRSSV